MKRMIERVARTTVGELISLILVLVLVGQTGVGPVYGAEQEQGAAPARQQEPVGGPVMRMEEAGRGRPAQTWGSAPQERSAEAPLGATGLSVSVGFADTSQATPNFPVPWQGSPNVVFLGSGSPVEAGAIRIDNSSGAPMSVDSVSVDLQRPGPVYSLWGSFVIPAQGSAILTQTAAGNFKTNSAPIVPCGGTIPVGDARIPKIAVTISGTATTFLDSTHVLDTGGFDASCRGNQSLEWRQVGAAGIERPQGSVVLTSGSASLPGGASYTAVAYVTDAAGAALAKAPVSFKVLNGPSQGATGQAVTDVSGNARFTFSSGSAGVDVLQASVVNATSGSIVANPVNVTWTSQSCGTGSGTAANVTNLTWLGATAGVYGQPFLLAALLTNGAGAALSGRSVTLGLGASSFPATTDGTGVARATVTPSTPGTVTATASFAGDSTQPAAQISKVLTIDKAPTAIRYTGKVLLGTAVPQTLTAKLTLPDLATPLAGRTVTFQIGALTATASTEANGVATASATLTPDLPSGPASVRVSFGGDAFYKASAQTVPVTVYLSTSFVVWGGNTGGLTLGQDVNFWGSQWPLQVIQGDYVAQGDFKGLADPVSQIHLCQVNATVQSLNSSCWSSKAGQSWPPPLTLPAYIEVIVSTIIVKRNGTIYGNIASAVVVQVDATPAYGPDPGKPGFGKIVAVIEDSGVLPPPATPGLTQSQPATVAPGQAITVTATMTNNSATAATGATLSESFDGLTPVSGSSSVGTISSSAVTRTFSENVPGIAPRGGSEQTADYLTRLSATNGRLYTSTGTLTFTDANNQIYLPVTATSSSLLQIPILSVALTGPATVSPGATVQYQMVVTNIGSAAANGTATLTTPAGGGSFSISGLAPGASVAFTQPWSAPAVAPIGPNESADQYVARLGLANGQTFTATASVTWSDATGNTYGPVSQQASTVDVRLPVLTFTPTVTNPLLPAQTATVNLTVQNTGGCTAVQSAVKVTNPDGTASTLPGFTVAAGQTTTVSSKWVVPAIAPHATGETDAQYRARLTAVDQATLPFTVALSWSDPAGSLYGPESRPVQATENVPIVVPAMTGPATAQSGNSITYAVSLSNVGHAAAGAVSLTVTLPDGSKQTPSVPALAVGGSYSTNIAFNIPTGQPAGQITATSAAAWTDTVLNGYGPLSASAVTTVSNPGPVNSLSLTPQVAGPDPVGSAQAFSVVLKDPSGNPIAGATVQYTVTGANPGSGSAVTDSTGTARFSYTGSVKGTDSVVVTMGASASNTATVSWVQPVQSISTTTLFGQFFTSPGGGGVFTTTPGTTPLFTQIFPTINFNPPAGTVPGMPSGLGIDTRPFTNVTTDLNGNFTGAIAAQGNGYQAGVAPLDNFQAVFAGSFTVASAGDVVFQLYVDDAFILGVGNGATSQPGSVMFNAPASGMTPFYNLPIMGAWNAGSPPTGRTVIVHFPGPGVYPYELDYVEGFGGQLSLTMAIGPTNTNATGVPPSGSLTLTPGTLQSKTVGQSLIFTATAKDASGLPQVGVQVALNVVGANPQHLQATTDSNGNAAFAYTGVNTGPDTVSASATVSGMAATSNATTVAWTGTNGAPAFVTPGWIGLPQSNSIVSGLVSLIYQNPTGATATGVVDFWPSNAPGQVQVLNANVSVSYNGVLATLDTTTLANGEYTVRANLTTNTGVNQISEIILRVFGQYKPGRVTTTVTDFTVPIAGLPIDISRTYDSLERGYVKDFGNGWDLRVGTRLDVNSSGDVSLTINGMRKTFYFTPLSQGFPFPFLLTATYTAEAGEFGKLTSGGTCQTVVHPVGFYECFPDTFDNYQPQTYTYTDPYGRQYTIGANGKVQQIKDLAGNTVSFSASGISSSTGNLNVPFLRDGAGRITQITDTTGKIYGYSYDTGGNLTSVSYPGLTQPANYTYDGTHLFTGGTDPRGNTLPTETYYADGKLKTVTQPRTPAEVAAGISKTTSYVYDLNQQTTTVTYPPDAGGNVGTAVMKYDSYGMLLRSQDPLGNATNYFYNPDHTLQQMTDAMGRTTSYTYDSNGNRTSQALPRTFTSVNTISRTVYNQFGEPIQTIDELLNVLNFSYDANFLPKIATDTMDGQPGTVVSFSVNANATIAATAVGYDLTALPNKATRYAYDGFGNLASETDQLSRVTNYSYDTMGRKQSMTTPRGGQTTYAYDGLGNLKTVTAPLGRVMRYEYDGNNNKTAETDPNGNRTVYQYDALNRVTEIDYPTTPATKKTYTYDFRGNVIDETDESGHVTHREYDLAGRLTAMTRGYGTADASRTTYGYDPDNRKTSETDANNHTTRWFYDEQGRLVQVTDARGQSVQYQYDDVGNRVLMIDPNGRRTQYQYDSRRRLRKTIFNNGTFTTQNYDSAGNLTNVTDQESQAVQYTFDDANQFRSVIQVSHPDPAHNTTSYAYDGDRNLITVTDANSHTSQSSFDLLDQLLSETMPAGGPAQTRTYDPAGNLLSLRDYNGRTTTYAYDTRNRLLSKTPDPSVNEPAVSFTYTPTGKRASMSDASGVTTYTYDNLDGLKTKATPQGTLSYTYDAVGNVTSVTSSNGNGVSLNYSYDEVNRLSTVIDNRLVGQNTTTYGYDNASNWVTVLYPNGIRSNMAYDDLNRLMFLEHRVANVQSYSYQLGGAGERQSATENFTRTVNWSYDGIHRLTNESISLDPHGNNGSVTYGLDPVANRLSQTSSLAPIGSGTFSYNPNDQLSTETYDGNGNTVVSGARTFTYDFENRVKTASGGAIGLIYDGDGSRSAKLIGGVRIGYLVDDLNPTGYSQVVEELNGGVVQRTYTYGLDRINQNQIIASAWTSSFYGYDGFGTVRLLTDVTGAVTNTYDYDAWGNTVNTTGSTPNVYLYRGEQYDPDLQLYYFRARYFNSLSGRFLTTDPAEGDVAIPISLHKYLYAWSDPANRLDPTGRSTVDPAKQDPGAGLLISDPLTAGGYLAYSSGPLKFDFGENRCSRAMSWRPPQSRYPVRPPLPSRPLPKPPLPKPGPTFPGNAPVIKPGDPIKQPYGWLFALLEALNNIGSVSIFGPCYIPDKYKHEPLPII